MFLECTVNELILKLKKFPPILKFFVQMTKFLCFITKFPPFTPMLFMQVIMLLSFFLMLFMQVVKFLSFFLMLLLHFKMFLGIAKIIMETNSQNRVTEQQNNPEPYFSLGTFVLAFTLC